MAGKGRDYIKVIDEQKEQLLRYEKRLKDVVVAYKSLLKEKEVLESSLKALSVSGSRKDGVQLETSHVSDGLSERSTHVHQLQKQVQILTEALSTLTEEKSKMEGHFQADKKCLKQERDELAYQLKVELQESKKEKGNCMEQIKDMREKLWTQQLERDNEQTNHAVMLRELQSVVAIERNAKEQIESQLDELQRNLDQRTPVLKKCEEYQSKIQMLSDELQAVRDRLKVAEEKATQPQPLLLHLKEEMEDMKVLHHSSVMHEQCRANSAEEQLQHIAQLGEERVASLETRLSEVSEMVGNYDRIRHQDQQAIQRLKIKLPKHQETVITEPPKRETKSIKPGTSSKASDPLAIGSGFRRILLNIPDINGSLEAGIAVGVDPRIPEVKRLPIMQNFTVSRLNAVCWAYEVCGAGHPVEEKEDLAIAAWFAHTANLLWFDTDEKSFDSDIVLTTAPFKVGTDTRVAIDKMVVDKRFAACPIISAMIATKANMWVLNHHTGSGKADCYVKKIIDVHFTSRDLESTTKLINMVGHWISTRRVLSQAGILGIELGKPIFPEATATFRLTADVKLQFNGLPAGTARNSVCMVIVRMLIGSPLFLVFPAVEDLEILGINNAAIQANRAGHHVDAQYLTGKRRVNYDDTTCNSVIGRLGAFITAIMPTSTLAKNPHVKNHTNADDYDPQWFHKCQAWKKSTILSQTAASVVSSGQQDIISITSATKITQMVLGANAGLRMARITLDRKDALDAIAKIGPSAGTSTAP